MRKILASDSRWWAPRSEVREGGLDGIFCGAAGVEGGEEQREEASIPDIDIENVVDMRITFDVSAKAKSV